MSTSLTRRRRLLKVFHLLLGRFGQRHWWPADRPWEMMVGAILVQNTAWTNVEKAILALKAASALSLPRIASMPRRQLEKLIHSSGFYHQKAKRLKNFAQYLQKHPSFYRDLRGKGPESSGVDKARLLREHLLSLHGIGPETADSILLYAGSYAVFVVDAYTQRICERLGLFKLRGYHAIQSFFERALPRKADLYNEFHALFVMEGKTYCTSSRPKCRECPLLKICPYGQKVMRIQLREN